MQHCDRPHSKRVSYLVGSVLSALVAPAGLLCNAGLAQETLAPSANSPIANRAAVVASDSVRDAAVALTQAGTVIFRDTPLAEVILILSEQWKVNIIAGAEVSGQVNGTFRNESLKSILDSVLTANSLHYRQIGNSLVVLPVNDTGGSLPSFQVEVLDVPVASKEELDELIDALKLQMSQEGQIVPIRASGKLTVQDTPERIAAVKALLAQIAPGASGQPAYVSTDSPGTLPAPGPGAGALPANFAPAVGALELRPQFILASDLQPPLEMIVGDANFSILEQENTIVIFGDADTQQKARLLMQQLDKPRPQVRITGYIYDVDLSEIEKLGVDWNQRMMTSAVDANGVPRNLAYGGSGLLVPNAVSNPAATLSGVVEDTATAAGAGAPPRHRPLAASFCLER